MRIARAPLWLAALLASGWASAQTSALSNFELERLDLNPGGQGSLFLGTGALLPAGGYRVSILAHYERNPLSYIQDGTRAGSVVSDRVTGHLAAAYAFSDRLELGAQVPVVVFQRGSDLSAYGLTAPSSFGLGTPLINGRFGILAERVGAPLDVAVELGVGLPLGSAAALAHESSVRLHPKVMLGKTLGTLRAGLEAGVLLRPSQALSPDSTAIADQVGNEVRGGVALSTTGKWLRGELDLRGAISLTKQPSALEALVGVRMPAGESAELFALGGLGLGSAPGTPLFRILLGLAFGDFNPRQAPVVVSVCSPGQIHTPEQCPDLDDDGDGVKNSGDKCPTEAGPVLRQGCPVKVVAPPDEDKDGVPDAQDQCPKEAGTAAHQGCPFLDADNDGIEDAKDKCPNEAGTVENQGCAKPPDADKDGIPDSQDLCPNEAGIGELKGCPDRDSDGDGVPDRVDNCPQQKGTPDNQGCPKEEKQLVTLAREKLEIKGKVFFDKEKAVIQKRSYGLLDQVAKVLIAHPEIPTVSIEGHTDSQGNPAENRQLSQRRAEAVRQYLISKGVAMERLLAKGFGADKPVDSNKTSRGRENNRRVEFIISTERTDTMEAPKR